MVAPGVVLGALGESRPTGDAAGRGDCSGAAASPSLSDCARTLPLCPLFTASLLCASVRHTRSAQLNAHDPAQPTRTMSAASYEDKLDLVEQDAEARQDREQHLHPTASPEAPPVQVSTCMILH